MIKSIHILFDYLCFPLWPFDENEQDEFYDDIPELRDHPDLFEKFTHLQNWYNELYETDSPYFFDSADEKERFLSEWHSALDEFLALAQGKYDIINHFNEFKSPE